LKRKTGRDHLKNGGREDIIQILKKQDWEASMDWNHMAPTRDQWQAFVNTLVTMNSMKQAGFLY
jgi:hypothetical protein